MFLSHSNFFTHRLRPKPKLRLKVKTRSNSLSTLNVLLLLNLILLELSSLAHGDPGWIQVCDNLNQFQLNSVDCPIGLWLKKPMTMGCVCVNGVWALSSGMCDPKTLILVGEGECFAVRKEVRAIKLIGNAEDPFFPQAFVTNPGFDNFIKIPAAGDPSFSPQVGINSAVVVSINPKTALLRSDKELCLKVSSNKGVKPVHFWKNPKREPNTFKTVDAASKDCEVHQTFTKNLDYSETFQDFWINPPELATQKCSYKCPTQPNGVPSAPRPSKAKFGKAGRGIFGPGSGRSAQAAASSAAAPSSVAGGSKKPGGGPPQSGAINWADLYTVNRKLKFINEEKAPRDEVLKRKEYYTDRFPLAEPLIEHTRETREQTVRMLQSQMNFLLLGQPTPKITTPEYLIFQKARQTFIAVAPPDLIPTRMVNGMMRMWRTLLWESHDKFNYREHPNEVYLHRILDKMNECLVNVSAYPMIFIDDRNASSHPSNCLMNNTKTTYWNETADETGKPKTVLLSNSSIAPEVKFNYTQLDFVIELAWKMVMFTQYHCSRWFKGAALDHSFMVNKMLSLFNPKVLKRWYNPENSLEGYKLVFPDIDFEHVAYSVDRIAEAARDASDFVEAEKWLKRPKIPASINDLQINSGGYPGIGKRKKRDAKKSAKKSRTNLWNQKAVCMESYWDPIDIHKYTPPSGCELPRTKDDI